MATSRGRRAAASASRPLLAICIPTHHGRARLLGELLDRLLPQVPADGNVEVFVSDNASRDETAEIIAARRAEIGERLRYRRHDRDLGLAANIFAAVEIASAEYCWLLGSDDAPAEGAVGRLVALLRANPGASGAHLGFLRGTMEDIDSPGVDFPPDILPSAARPQRIRSVEDYARECGVVALPLSCNVVNRDRWQAVVAAERREAERTPITPHVYVIGRMLQRDPDWLWSEDRLTLLREAPVFLTEDAYMGERGKDLGRQFRAIAADLDRAWARVHGRGSDVHRTLMATFGHYIMHPAAAAVGKLTYARGIGGDLRYLGFARHFWHDREFRRKTLPLLLTPTALIRVPEGSPAPGDQAARARLHAAIPERMATGRGAWVEVLVENIGSTTLSFARPHYAALYARWTDPRSGEAVEERMYNTPLYPPVRPGRTRRLKQLVTVPAPGTHRLTIDLFSRATHGTLTGEALTGEVETELTSHIELPAS